MGSEPEAKEDYKRIEFSYGLILLRTKRFQSLMDRLGAYRISKPVGWALLYLMPVAGAIGVYLFLSVLVGLLSPRGPVIAQGIVSLGPLANLGIPGLNPYIPIVYGWIALVVAMVIHEGAHGIIARSLGLPVKNSGLIFFLFVPIGAFVDVEEGPLKSAKNSYSGRVLAAGAGVNLVAAVVSLLLLVAIVGAMTPIASGAGIVAVGQGTPAFNSGVQPGDIVTAFNGQPITDLQTVLGPNTTLQAGQIVNLTVYRNGQTIQIDGVKLACCNEIIDTATNQTLAKYPYIGVSALSESQLQSTVTSYSHLTNNLWLYVACIPTLERGGCVDAVPFTGPVSVFYQSPLGPALLPLANQLYWLFFLNFNLAVFNALPIYPLDGGQAFRVLVKALGRGKLSETTLTRITIAATLVIVGMLAAIIAGPYVLALVG